MNLYVASHIAWISCNYIAERLTFIHCAPHTNMIFANIFNDIITMIHQTLSAVSVARLPYEEMEQSIKSYTYPNVCTLYPP